MASHVALPVGSVFAGRFRVTRVIGSGTHGSTYAVDGVPSGGPCALKVMNAALVAKDGRAGYAAEAMSAARLDSPHLVRTLAAGVDETTGQPWLATELLPGQGLATRLHLWGRLPIEEVRQIVGALGEALGTAHASGRAHHELAPRKVHLLQDSERGVMLRDLGISKLLARALAADETSGTWAVWAAPEQLIDPGTAATPAGNVWSLGLIAFHALTNRSYWMGTSADAPTKAVLSELLSGPLVPASERAAALGCEGVIPAWFDAWFARCVARDPAERFKDAKEARAEWAARDEVDDHQRLTVPFVGDDGRPTIRLPPRLSARPTTPTPPVTTAARTASPVTTADRAASPVAPPASTRGSSRPTAYRRLAAVAGAAAVALLWWTSRAGCGDAPRQQREQRARGLGSRRGPRARGHGYRWSAARL
jgi:serine/threonine protein kinase